MMNEELENFEQRLRGQPLKIIPGEWRAEILTNCRRSNVEDHAPESLWLSTFVSQLSTIFWPHPKAWGALAAVWICIFVLNFSARDKAPLIAKSSPPPSPETIVELKQQRRLFVELIGANDWQVADRQKVFSPKPRSESTEVLMT